jgi:hypothetical protein
MIVIAPLVARARRLFHIEQRRARSDAPYHQRHFVRPSLSLSALFYPSLLLNSPHEITAGRD